MAVRCKILQYIDTKLHPIHSPTFKHFSTVLIVCTKILTRRSYCENCQNTSGYWLNYENSVMTFDMLFMYEIRIYAESCLLVLILAMYVVHKWKWNFVQVAEIIVCLAAVGCFWCRTYGKCDFKYVGQRGRGGGNRRGGWRGRGRGQRWWWTAQSHETDSWKTENLAFISFCI